MDPGSILSKILIAILGLVVGAFATYSVTNKRQKEKIQEKQKELTLERVTIHTLTPLPGSLPPHSPTNALHYLQNREKEKRSKQQDLESMISKTQGIANELEAQIAKLAPKAVNGGNEPPDIQELADNEWKRLGLPKKEEIAKLLSQREAILKKLDKPNPDLKALRAQASEVDKKINELSSWNAEKVKAALRTP